MLETSDQAKIPNRVAKTSISGILSKTTVFNKNCGVTSSYKDKRLKYFETQNLKNYMLGCPVKMKNQFQLSAILTEKI